MRNLTFFLNTRTFQHADLYALVQVVILEALVFLSLVASINMSSLLRQLMMQVICGMWFRLHNVVLDCPEVYFCVCYMPQKKDFTHLQRNTPTAICPYECLQKDILEFQCKATRSWSAVTSTPELQKSQIS